jgi:hypothetical protein
MVLVVVFPSVPVTPATVSDRDGSPYQADANALIATRELLTRTTGTCGGRGGSKVCSATTATAPAATAAAAWRWPSWRRPVMATKSEPDDGDARAAVHDRRRVDPRRGEQVEQCNHVAAV